MKPASQAVPLSKADKADLMNAYALWLSLKQLESRASFTLTHMREGWWTTAQVVEAARQVTADNGNDVARVEALGVALIELAKAEEGT